MDCYLIEGDKVLHRICLALVRLFAKAAKRNSRTVDIAKRGAADAYLDFCRNIDVRIN